jgi:hypothetical protein
MSSLVKVACWFTRYAAKSAVDRALLRMEVENDDFFRFVWRGFPLASVDGVHCSLNEKGMSAQGLGRLCGAIGKDHGFDFDGSSELHVASETGIGWDNLRNKFALGFELILLGAR